MIFAIDPGNIRSAYVVTDDDLNPVEFGIVENEDLIEIIEKHQDCEYAIEMIASYGMPVGKEVFDTCVYIGRFFESVRRFGVTPIFVYRQEEKLCICKNTRARDSNIRQALIDRFGVVGTKKNKGFFYGFKKDIWQAFAVAVVYHDEKREEKKNKVYNRNKTKRIHEPYVNGYCEKCIHNDGDVDNLCCKKIGRFVHCGAVVECALYEEEKENVSKV